MEASSNYVNVEIPKSTTDNRSGQEVVFFQIVVKYNNDSWVVKHRYSEFDLLNTALKERFPDIPSLPAKLAKYLSFFGNNDPLEERRKGLEEYLVYLAKKRVSYSCPEFCHFLNIHIKVPELQLASIAKRYQHKYEYFGIREPHFTANGEMMIAAMADMHIASRVDTMLAFNMSWGFTKYEKDNLANKQGVAASWHIQRGLDPIVKKKSMIGFESQGICSDFVENAHIFAIGFDNGVVDIYRVQNGEIKEKLFGDKVHLKRLMKVQILIKRMLMYSIGEDGYIRCINLKTYKIMSEKFVSESELTCMQIHPLNSTAVITDRSGGIFILDVFSDPPVELKCFNLPNPGAIRGLAVDFETGKIFISNNSDSYIYYYKIKLPVKQTSLVERVSVKKGFPYPRNLYYDKKRRELHVGDGYGFVYCLDVDNFEDGIIDSIKAHNDEIVYLGEGTREGEVVTTAKDETIKFWQVPSDRKELGSIAKDEVEVKKSSIKKLPISKRKDSGSSSSSDQEILVKNRNNPTYTKVPEKKDPAPQATLATKKIETVAQAPTPKPARQIDNYSDSDSYDNWQD